MPTPKSSAMVGSEMLTMLPLRVLMKAPTDTAESTSHFRFFGERSCLDVTSNLLSGSCQRARPSARILDRYPFAEPLTPLPRQQYQGRCCIRGRRSQQAGRTPARLSRSAGHGTLAEKVCGFGTLTMCKRLANLETTKLEGR